jgi:hypothetical protein
MNENHNIIEVVALLKFLLHCLSPRFSILIILSLSSFLLHRHHYRFFIIARQIFLVLNSSLKLRLKLHCYSFCYKFFVIEHLVFIVMPIHGLIHDDQLRACPYALLGLMYGLRRMYAIRYLRFQFVGDSIKGPNLSFSF